MQLQVAYQQVDTYSTMLKFIITQTTVLASTVVPLVMHDNHGYLTLAIGILWGLAFIGLVDVDGRYWRRNKLAMCYASSEFVQHLATICQVFWFAIAYCDHGVCRL